LVLAVPGLLLAKDLTVPIDRLGPYKLGMSLADAKKLPEFTIDEKRSEPDKGIIAGRIIGKLFDKVTVQRSFFNQNGLFRATIIFGDSKVTEDDVKAIVAAEWGDPGPKVEVGDTKNYIWKGTNACFILIVTGDEGRVLVSIACQGS